MLVVTTVRRQTICYSSLLSLVPVHILEIAAAGPRLWNSLPIHERTAMNVALLAPELYILQKLDVRVYTL